MSALIVDLEEYKARRIVEHEAEKLAAELFHWQAGESRQWMADYYVTMGWANAADVRRALEALGEK